MSNTDPVHLAHLAGIVDGLRAAAREAVAAGHPRLAARLYARMTRIEAYELHAFVQAHGGWQALQRLADAARERLQSQRELS